MKKFRVYLNEQKNEDELINYKNFVFNDGLIILSDFKVYSWHHFTNFNSEGTITIKTKRKNVVFQFIQGVPVISIPVTYQGSGNLIIDDIYEFASTKEFIQLQEYVTLEK